MKHYNRITPSFTSDTESDKRGSVSLETAGENQINGIASRLKKFCCEKFIFGERLVFGRKEFVDGAHLGKDYSHYTWPVGKVHSLSRDPHPDLEERFHVADDKVSWKTCPDEAFESYKPEFAIEDDRNEALKIVMEKRKPDEKLFSSLAKKTVNRTNSNRILDCRDLSLELQATSCRPSNIDRNPYGRLIEPLQILFGCITDTRL